MASLGTCWRTGGWHLPSFQHFQPISSLQWCSMNPITDPVSSPWLVCSLGAAQHLGRQATNAIKIHWDHGEETGPWRTHPWLRMSCWGMISPHTQLKIPGWGQHAKAGEGLVQPILWGHVFLQLKVSVTEGFCVVLGHPYPPVPRMRRHQQKTQAHRYCWCCKMVEKLPWMDCKQGEGTEGQLEHSHWISHRSHDHGLG